MSQTTTDGDFIPLLPGPVNFAVLYEDAQKRNAAEIIQ
ncbi:MAG: hypothetical protein GQ578_10385 [Desulfuromonadaceae bacterium]|nr:hypothetical protein [Desulfuromonadaceae bacterium]